MKLKNHELEPFILFLQKLILSGKPSRMRTRFKNLLIEKYVEFNKEREDIIKQYGQKDENGELIVEEENGVKIHPFIEEYKQQASNELNELFNEDVIIDETGERIEMLKSVKRTVLDYSEPNSGKEADDWDRFCEIMEQINIE